MPDRIPSKPAARCKLEISKYSWTFSPLPLCVCVCVCVCIDAQSCLTRCDPMACSPPGSSVHGDVSRQEYWSELSCPPPEDLPSPGIEPRSPSLQADSLPSESLGKPPLSLTQNKNFAVVTGDDPPKKSGFLFPIPTERWSICKNPRTRRLHEQKKTGQWASIGS